MRSFKLDLSVMLFNLFGHPFFQFSAQPFPTPYRKWFMVGTGSVKLSFSTVTVLVDGCLQGWFLLTGLSWNIPAVLGIISCRAPNGF